MQSDYPFSESVTVEFKSAFNISVIESLVAFANTQGGTVYVGINDHAEVIGVVLNKETVVRFVNEIKGKTSPSLVPNVEITSLEGKKIVLLTIPEYPIKPVSVQGRYYKRVNNSNHLLATVRNPVTN